MGTYCKVEMKFTDVTALSDAEVSTEDNQSIGNVSNFKEQIAQADYGTLELNQFVLDASKRLLDEPEDIAFWNENLSKKDCSFEVNPKVSIHFTKQHSSSGLTFYFEDTYPAEMQVIWYTLDGIKLDAKTFYPDSLIFVCKHQVQNYGKIEIEFIRTTFPETYIKLQYILYGRYIVWDRDMIQTATVQEDIDLIHCQSTRQMSPLWMSIMILMWATKMEHGNPCKKTKRLHCQNIKTRVSDRWGLFTSMTFRFPEIFPSLS